MISCGPTADALDGKECPSERLRSGLATMGDCSSPAHDCDARVLFSLVGDIFVGEISRNGFKNAFNFSCCFLFSI